jgi:4-amino-4-deoxy-L-arabinose transferase-like glycosyltransferase
MESSRIRSPHSPLRIAYLLAAGLCLALRLLYVGTADPHALFNRWSIVTDAYVYDQFGWNLATRGVLGVGDRPSGFAMPGYPILIAGVYRVAGHLPGAVRWLQAVLGFFSVLAIGRMAGHLAGQRAELLAVAAGAVYPHFIYFTREILTECLFITAYSGMLLTALLIGKSGRVADGILHGACLSIAALTRPVGVLLEPAVLILARPWARDHRRSRLAGLLAGLLVFAIAWGAWIARNRRVFGETIPFDTHGGFSLYLGHLQSIGASLADLDYNHEMVARGELPGGPRGELEIDRRSGEKAWKIIRENPRRSALTFLNNGVGLWTKLSFSEVAAAAKMVSLVTVVGWLSYPPVLLLGLAGLWKLYRDHRSVPLLAFLAAFATTSAVHALIAGGQRYRVATVDPILLVLAALAADAAIAAFRKSRSVAAPFRSTR